MSDGAQTSGLRCFCATKLQASTIGDAENLRCPEASTLLSDPSPSRIPSKRMADGKEWLRQNLDIQAEASDCYDDSDRNCRQYGRLYTWESA